MYYKAAVTKTPWYWHQDIQIDPWNGLESPETDLHIFNYFITKVFLQFSEGKSSPFNKQSPGCLGGSVVGLLPLAQGMILETLDQVPRQALCMEPASPSAVSLPLFLSVCLSVMNK